MQDAFAKTFSEQRLASPGDRVLVALSGGADSVALVPVATDRVAEVVE